jgi:hypothetical protein
MSIANTHNKPIYPILWAVDGACFDDMPIPIDFCFCLQPVPRIGYEVSRRFPADPVNLIYESDHKNKVLEMEFNTDCDIYFRRLSLEATYSD